MKITRNPYREHVGNGGEYIGNMNRAVIILDNKPVDSREVIEAEDGEQGHVLYLVRDESGHAVMDGSEPKTKRVDGNVVIQYHKEPCTGCAEASRKRRQTKAWWYL